jgi:uncharacterized damage-inducible protein DinB
MEKEFATTAKVMRAFPASQSGFTPHERSNSALKLMATFVLEMYLIDKYALGGQFDDSFFQTYKPQSVSEVIKDWEQKSSEILKKLAAVSDEDLTGITNFYGHQSARDRFALMMLFDQIHHRGQLSVYVRLAGGRVPAIYGPSADDESTNL